MSATIPALPDIRDVSLAHLDPESVEVAALLDRVLTRTVPVAAFQASI